MGRTPDKRMFKKYTELEGWQTGLWGENYIVYDVKEDDSSMDVYLKSVPHAAVCPCCGEESSKLASGYGRTLKDIPLKGLMTTHLHVQTYKYVCQNPGCSVKTFADPLPFAHLNEYRTDRLTQLILGMSMCMSNEGTSRVLRLMGVSVSADAVDRLWRKVQLRDVPDVGTVGIDDIALRKGQTYATSVYGEDHQLIAILDGRTADDVKGWLAAHPKIRRVARDRASAYASAISEVLPEAVQTADRFHLLQNLLKHLEKVLKDDLPEEFWAGENGLIEKDEVKWTRKTESTQPQVDTSDLSYDNTPPVDACGREVQYDAQNHLTGSTAAREREEKRRQKQERVRAVREAYAEGMTKAEISREMHLSPGAVTRYVGMSEEEVDALVLPKRRQAASRAGRYRNIVFKMMQDGWDDRTIFWYLRSAGIDDPARSICTVIRTISVNNFPDRQRMHTSRITGESARNVPVNAERISRRQVGVYLCTLDENREPYPAYDRCEADLLQKYPKAAWIRDAFCRFHTAIMGDDPDAVVQFVADYRDTNLKSFCNGLEMDMAAVLNAVRSDLSSGFVEGGNNKIKVIKRIGYGRASLRSLEAKCVIAFQSTKIPEFDTCTIVDFPSRRVRRSAA